MQHSPSNRYTFLTPPMAQQTPLYQGRLIIEASRSHSKTPHSVGLLWTSDQTGSGISTWQYIKLTTDRQTDIHFHVIPQSTQSRYWPRL